LEGSSVKGHTILETLSVIIAGRQEEFFAKTVENVIENSNDCTNVICVADGYKPYPQIQKHPRVRVIFLDRPIGQRAAVNLGVKESNAKYMLKLDAHCAVDKDFDLKLMANMEPDWTVVPRMYNLYAYDWKCYGCGKKQYQGRSFSCCGPVKKKMIWKPKTRAVSDFMKFDKDMQFGYWSSFRKRPEAQYDICEQLCAVGACWFMDRERYLDLDMLDEKTGSWGQVGVEVACKSWLSGGKQVVNKKTWFAHLFRTGNFEGTGHNGGTFPYPLSGGAVQYAKKYSRDLWLNDRWDKAKYPLSWLVDRFKPVPGWHE
jgi:glycosyltransferase involved in cell wall biosynthesis